MFFYCNKICINLVSLSETKEKRSLITSHLLVLGPFDCKQRRPLQHPTAIAGCEKQRCTPLARAERVLSARFFGAYGAYARRTGSRTAAYKTLTWNARSSFRCGRVQDRVREAVLRDRAAGMCVKSEESAAPRSPWRRILKEVRKSRLNRENSWRLQRQIERRT